MNGKVVIGCELETKSFDAQIIETEMKLNRLTQAYEKASKPGKGFKKNEEALKSLSVQIEQANNKLVSLKKRQADLNKIPKNVSNVGSGLKNVISSVGKWAIAMFGIQSAYSAITQAMSIIGQYNEQVGADVEYIKFALASSLQPIVEWLINATYKLLILIQSLIYSIFKINIFSNATSKNFKKVQGSLDDSKKSAKEIQKSLAGFDEMNVLTDTSSKGGSGGATGAGTPQFDLSLEPQEINWDDFFNSAFTAVEKTSEKIKTFISNFLNTIKENIKNIMSNLGFSDEFISTWEFMFDGIKKQWEGLIDIVGGVLEIIIGVLSGDKEKILSGVQKLLEGILNVILGAIQFWLGALGMFVVAIYDTVIKPIWENIKEAWEKWKKLFSDSLDFIKDLFKQTVEKWKEILGNVGDFFKNLWQGIKDGVGDAVQWIKDKFYSIVDFFGDIISKIVGFFKTIGTKVGDAIGGAFKSAINSVLKAAETILNTPINAINKLINKVNELPGINLGRLNTFKFPRLAKGGIINQPGRGVPVGSAIGGERGQEGVLPLTDSQQMQLLGEAIGRYVTINASIINTMNGRVISRELQKINNTNNFAFNR